MIPLFENFGEKNMPHRVRSILSGVGNQWTTNISMINPEICKPLGSETHGALFKTVFFKICTVLSTEPKVLQILLLLILTRGKHIYPRGVHC